MNGSEAPYIALPRTKVPGAVWPPVPSENAAKHLALQYQLEQSQWWPLERLERAQFRQLGQLAAHAWQTVPFYHTRLAEAGYGGQGEMTPEIWRRIPPLTRRDVQQAGNDLNSTSVPQSHGQIGSLSTSGSTGTPVTVKKTGLEQIYFKSFNLRTHLWHRRDFSKTMAVIRAFHGKHAYPDGTRREQWGQPIGQMFKTGPSFALDIATDIAQQCEWLVRIKPDYLLSHATNLMFLARHCKEAGLSLPALKEVASLGEIVDGEVRETCREIWGVEVKDIYTSVELGYMAVQCPDFDHYHVQAESCLLEILDDAGEPVKPGELGRVVVTPLHNFATPLLRYEVGDYAEAGEPCPCGRSLPVIKRIVGRRRDMVVLPSGEKRFGWLSSRGLAKIDALVQYQVVQKTPEAMEVRLVAHRPLNEEEREIVRATIVQSFGYDFALTFTYHDELPRAASGKFFVFRSEVPA